jgi:protein-S-isoprenylcysteine O-methyltransferase Ste14
VRTGVFGVVRNPIYIAMLIWWLGITLVMPNAAAIGGYLVLIAIIELQVHLVEEPFLLRVHGQDYRRYAGTVGRFLPGIGLIR